MSIIISPISLSRIPPLLFFFLSSFCFWPLDLLLHLPLWFCPLPPYPLTSLVLSFTPFSTYLFGSVLYLFSYRLCPLPPYPLIISVMSSTPLSTYLIGSVLYPLIHLYLIGYVLYPLIHLSYRFCPLPPYPLILSVLSSYLFGLFAPSSLVKISLTFFFYFYHNRYWS